MVWYESPNNRGEGIMKHPVNAPKVDTLPELGIMLGQLRYDALRRVLQELAAELTTQAVKDHHAGNPRLSCLGAEVSGLIHQASAVVDEMFGISVSHMEADLTKCPEIPHKVGL